MRVRPCVVALAAALLAAQPEALAFDKQGSAHGGEVGGDEGGFDISGGLTLGAAIINPTYAARPDNTGLALFRYAAHADVDLIGKALSIPVDLNMFTDREKKGGGIFVPSEVDDIIGMTTTQALLNWSDLELGARVEHDRPADRGGFTQSYADVRARALYSLAKISPALERDLVDGDISGFFGLGWFALNPTYAARPDNSGKALFRYVGHTQLSVWHDHVSLGFDATFFTDRREHVVQPSELDATYEIIGRLPPFEAHLAYERDMPIDRGGLVQGFVYGLLVWGFDLKRDPPPLERRGTIPSP